MPEFTPIARPTDPLRLLAKDELLKEGDLRLTTADNCLYDKWERLVTPSNDGRTTGTRIFRREIIATTSTKLLVNQLVEHRNKIKKHQDLLASISYALTAVKVVFSDKLANQEISKIFVDNIDEMIKSLEDEKKNLL